MSVKIYGNWCIKVFKKDHQYKTTTGTMSIMNDEGYDRLSLTLRKDEFRALAKEFNEMADILERPENDSNVND